MNPCNQISAADGKDFIRRMKSQKSVYSNNKKVQPIASVLHQTNNFLPATPRKGCVEASKYMNTYRLEPKNRFNGTLVQSVLREIVQKHCFRVKYDPVLSECKVKTIAGEIMRRVKNFEFDRYRLIVFVQIGENLGQELETSVKFLWDSSKDNFVTYNFTTGFTFTTATCFGVYQD